VEEILNTPNFGLGEERASNPAGEYEEIYLPQMEEENKSGEVCKVLFRGTFPYKKKLQIN
jgi:hypothetical protein